METEKLIYPHESYGIIGAAMEVHNTLGQGFLESVYQEAMEIELKKRNIPFEPQCKIQIRYKDVCLDHFNEESLFYKRYPNIMSKDKIRQNPQL